MNKKVLALAIGLAGVALSSGVAQAVTLEELAEKVDALSRENAELRARVEALQASQPAAVVREDLAEMRPVSPPVRDDRSVLQVNHRLSYELLDPTQDINRKQLYLLGKKRSGEAPVNGVLVGGALTAIADYQRSNTDSKFGYLMRHPTASNQRTRTVSEAVIHSAQVHFTANVGEWATGHIEMLYNPEQSFGAGTITDINRNQVEVRRGYVLFGNLEKSPYYLSLGKMDVPFALTDTVNPFTDSTVWHAFGGLAYGIQGGYSAAGVDIRLMGVQGGSQFRAANVPVDNSNVPSELNNYAVDLGYTLPLDASDRLLMGASYIKGSAYCQNYPVTHFSACREENGAYSLYSRLHLDRWTLQAEFARTEEEWPGTFNPSIPQFSAAKVTSWDVGGKYATRFRDYPVDVSLDFSRFVAGPDGSPWEFQDQWVFGVAGYLAPSVKLFGELIRTEGYAPLNFISGGNLAPGQTHSDRDAHSNIILLGTNLAF